MVAYAIAAKIENNRMQSYHNAAPRLLCYAYKARAEQPARAGSKYLLLIHSGTEKQYETKFDVGY
jgi:hypothetical protein